MSLADFSNCGCEERERSLAIGARLPEKHFVAAYQRQEFCRTLSERVGESSIVKLEVLHVDIDAVLADHEVGPEAVTGRERHEKVRPGSPSAPEKAREKMLTGKCSVHRFEIRGGTRKSWPRRTRGEQRRPYRRDPALHRRAHAPLASTTWCKLVHCPNPQRPCLRFKSPAELKGDGFRIPRGPQSHFKFKVSPMSPPCRPLVPTQIFQ